MGGIKVRFPKMVFDNVSKDNVPKDVSKEILSIIENNPNITTGEIANQLNVTRRTVTRQIRQLKEKVLLEIVWKQV
jgi:predicted HTH transcriptional regulator